jgi:peptidoglycan hydrolase-like protein with peptidoglycan-binding domain
MKHTTKVSVAVLMFLAFGLSLYAPAPVHAQEVVANNSPLQAELATLASQIAELQLALTATSTVIATNPLTTVSDPTSSVFYRDLTLGDSGPDVRALQEFLNAKGGLAEVNGTGPGSLGNETDYYGLYTETAVARWQTMEGILPAQGYFGASTRALVIAQENQI